jgi:hypothetical protein
MAILTQIKESNLPLKQLFTISVSVSFIFVALGLLSQFILPPEIPLFYGLPKNSQQLAPSIFVILPSVISMLLTIVNAIISINTDGVYLKKSLAFASIAICLLSIIATYKIVFLVGSI